MRKFDFFVKLCCGKWVNETFCGCNCGNVTKQSAFFFSQHKFFCDKGKDENWIFPTFRTHHHGCYPIFCGNFAFFSLILTWKLAGFNAHKKKNFRPWKESSKNIFVVKAARGMQSHKNSCSKTQAGSSSTLCQNSNFCPKTQFWNFFVFYLFWIFAPKIND